MKLIIVVIIVRDVSKIIIGWCFVSIFECCNHFQCLIYAFRLFSLFLFLSLRVCVCLVNKHSNFHIHKCSTLYSLFFFNIQSTVVVRMIFLCEHFYPTRIHHKQTSVKYFFLSHVRIHVVQNNKNWIPKKKNFAKTGVMNWRRERKKKSSQPPFWHGKCTIFVRFSFVYVHFSFIWLLIVVWCFGVSLMQRIRIHDVSLNAHVTDKMATTKTDRKKFAVI